MKRLLFLLPVLFFLNAPAQQPYYHFKKIPGINDSSYVFPLERKMSIDSLKEIIGEIQTLSNTQSLGRLLHTLPNGTNFYALPQDNMICLVPDMSQFNMPVMGKGIKITGMPPGSIPPNNIFPKKE